MTTPSNSDLVPVPPPASAAKLPVTVDTRGRVRTTREQRRLILAEFERSGLSAAGFAQRTGLKYSTLAGWVQRYYGVNLSRQTLCGWVQAAADWLSPIYREMKVALVAQDYLQADETAIRYLDPDVKVRSQQG